LLQAYEDQRTSGRLVSEVRYLVGSVPQ
jgi:hypothetical protein